MIPSTKISVNKRLTELQCSELKDQPWIKNENNFRKQIQFLEKVNHILVRRWVRAEVNLLSY